MALEISQGKRYGETWILVADSGHARILEMPDPTNITEIQGMDHALGRYQNRELKTDAEGRFFGNMQGNTSEPDVTPEKHEAMLFADAISEFLSDSFNRQRFTKLQLIIQPEFLGILRKKLNEQIQKSM